MVTLDRVADLSLADREAVRLLSLAVYPPAQWADSPGRKLEWSTAEWCVRVRRQDMLVSYVGIYLREATCDGQPARVGGIGNVKTHPQARGYGFASLGILRAVTFLDESAADFGLLVCGPALIEYYQRLGWREFTGRLFVRQHGAISEFTFNRVMTLEIRSPAPVAATIDLCGPPW
jgi:hypothetical protein